MPPLTAHLPEAGDHGRLGFHPRCRVCRRERWFRAPSSQSVASRRVQAALATGLLAFSVAAPSVAAAGEPSEQREGVVPPDQQREGVVPPEQPMEGVPEQPGEGVIDEPTFDPGGETELPSEVSDPAAPVDDGDQGTDEGEPLETEPVEDPDARLVAPTESELDAPPSTEDAPVAPSEGPPLAPVPPEPGPTMIPSPPAEADEPASLEAPESTTRSKRLWEEGERGRAPRPRSEETTRAAPLESLRRPPTDVAAPSVGISPQRSLPASGTNAADSSETVVLAKTHDDQDGGAATNASTDSRPHSLNARFYVVKPGDSLWSITRKLLGPSASPAQIAREVNRLWALNKDRIGTGDPDLLMAGVTLRLR